MMLRSTLILIIALITGCGGGSGSRSSGSSQVAPDEKGNMQLVASDGFAIYSNYQISTVSQNYVVLLVHRESSNLHEYDSIIDDIKKAGFDTLAIDSRMGGTRNGYDNESIKAAGISGGKDMLAAAVKDVQAAVSWLKSQGVLKIFVTGSGMGASVVLRYFLTYGAASGIACFSPAEDFSDFKFSEKTSTMSFPFFMTQGPKEDGISKIFKDVPTAGNFVRYFPKRGTRGADALNKTYNPNGYQAMRENYLRFLVQSAKGEISSGVKVYPLLNN